MRFLTRDRALDGGRCGGIAGDAVRLTKFRVQRVDAAVFHDGFARAETTPGEWWALQGDWAIAALRKADFSANAFCLRGGGRAAWRGRANGSGRTTAFALR